MHILNYQSDNLTVLLEYLDLEDAKDHGPFLTRVERLQPFITHLLSTTCTIKVLTLAAESFFASLFNNSAFKCSKIK